MTRTPLALCLTLCVLGPAAAGPADDAKVAEVLRAGLPNFPELKEVRVSGASAAAPGRVRLTGTVHAGDLRDAVEKEALALLADAVAAGTLAGPFEAVDAAAMVDRSAPRGDQVAFVLARELSGAARPPADVRGAAVDRSGRVTLSGWVATEAKRREAAAAAGEVLIEAVRRGDLDGPLGPVDPSGLVRSPHGLHTFVAANMLNFPELQNVELVYTAWEPDGRVKLFGLLADESQRERIRAEATAVLRPDDRLRENLDAWGIGIEAVTEVDVSAMLVGDSAAARRDLIQRALPRRPGQYLFVESFDPTTGTARVSGYSRAAGPGGWGEVVEGFTIVNSVASDDILGPADEEARRTLHALSVGANAALERRDGEALVALGGAIVSAGDGEPQVALEGWYYRAAGHLLLGRAASAAADLRAAAFLEGDTADAIHARLLERFQGPERGLLEQLRWSVRNVEPPRG